MSTVFVDCDAALVQWLPSGRPQADLRLRPGAREGLDRLAQGNTVAILVDPTLKDRLLPHQQDDRLALVRHAIHTIRPRPIVIACPHGAERCECRKPGVGLVERARARLGMRSAGWLIGADDRDLGAGRAAGLRTILIAPALDGLRRSALVSGEYHARNLLDAANWLLLQAVFPASTPPARA